MLATAYAVCESSPCCSHAKHCCSHPGRGSGLQQGRQVLSDPGCKEGPLQLYSAKLPVTYAKH